MKTNQQKMHFDLDNAPQKNHIGKVKGIDSTNNSFVHEPLLRHIREEILGGQFKPGQPIGTEKSLAVEADISRNSVRRAVDQLVREGLVQRRPGRGKGVFVRAPHQVVQTVQIVVPNLLWHHCAQIAVGAQSVAASKGIRVQISDAHESPDLELAMLKALPASDTDGALVISLHDPRFTEALFSLKAADYPWVLVDQRIENLEVPSVEIDNYGGGYAVGRELAGMGHRRIAFLGALRVAAVARRLDGLRDAMLDAGVLFDRTLVGDVPAEGIFGSINASATYSLPLVQTLLSRPDRPTVLFDGSGDAIPYACRALRELGLRIPHDVSFVTFEDSPVCELMDPPVACVRQPWDTVGRAAMQMLLDRMDRRNGGVEFAEAQHQVVPFTWVPRASLAPPGQIVMRQSNQSSVISNQ
ncbi:MAG: GntR family transcriptional regulator [Verrucomicrobia bacterium]|nr:GntR family transcriptional regulator [Verrucomicrobiota bacterium]